MKKTKIVCIGAGSFSFGLSTLITLLKSDVLRGSELVLVDRDPKALELICTLANWLNDSWGAQKTISSYTHHHDALKDANFVISAIEVPPREKLWEEDFNISLKYGLRQPYAENGGPGGFAHAARNILPVLDIVHDMEEQCPEALFINFSNPMARICTAIYRYSTIKVVGLCHQLGAGYAMAAKALAADLNIDLGTDFLSAHAGKENFEPMARMGHLGHEKLKIFAAGLNHFTWILEMRNRQTGEDLYPLFRNRWQGLDPHFEPLTREVFDAFGYFPVPGDEHLCEYLPWVADPLSKPWEKYDISLYDWREREKARTEEWHRIGEVLQTRDNPDQFLNAFSEGAVEIIENTLIDGNLYWEAVNIPNANAISNLPDDSIVELPGLISARGITGVQIGDLPEGITELLRREVTCTSLCVDSAVWGDRQLALQCLLLDPMITDIDMAKNILNDYLVTYKDLLPQYWQ